MSTYTPCFNFLIFIQGFFQLFDLHNSERGGKIKDFPKPGPVSSLYADLPFEASTLWCGLFYRSGTRFPPALPGLSAFHEASPLN